MALDMNALARYEPRWPGVVELNIGDEWRARWVDETELPETAPVAYAYALVYMSDKGYVTRKADTDRWGVVEGDLQKGEKIAAWLKRASVAQVGATPGKTELVGYLECKATSHNAEYPAGAMTVRPVYLVVAKQVKDIPEGSGYQRRRLPLNEHARAVRDRYPELDLYLLKAMDRYAIMRGRGEA